MGFDDEKTRKFTYCAQCQAQIGELEEIRRLDSGSAVCMYCARQFGLAPELPINKHNTLTMSLWTPIAWFLMFLGLCFMVLAVL